MVEKNLSGWWLVSSDGSVGVVPAVCLEKFSAASLNEPFKYSVNPWELFGAKMENSIQFSNSQNLPPRSDLDETTSISTDNFNSLAQKQDDIYYVMEDYLDPVGDCLNLKKGQKVRVLDRETSSGWCYVLIEDLMTEGWAPSSFLSKEKVKPPRPPRPKVPIIIPSEIKENDNSSIEGETFYNPIRVSEMRKKFENF